MEACLEKVAEYLQSTLLAVLVQHLCTIPEADIQMEVANDEAPVQADMEQIATEIWSQAGRTSEGTRKSRGSKRNRWLHWKRKSLNMERLGCDMSNCRWSRDRGELPDRDGTSCT